MITDATFPVEEASFADILRDAGWLATPPINQRRIEAIELRAMHETIIRESTEFIVMNFAATIPELFGALTGKVGRTDIDYRV